MENEGTPLSDLLSDNEPEQPQAPEEPVTETEDRPRGPDGKFVAKEPETGVEPQPATEAEVEPPSTGLPKEEYGALRAIRDENKGLKQQLEALQQQFQQIQQPKEPPPPPPSVWEDEKGWSQHLQQQIIQQADQLSRINASEMAARAQNPDFQEMFDLFNTMAQSNPSVVQQAMADPHPWGRAYQIAKNYKSMQDLGAVDVADLEAKMREKVMAELQQGQTPVPQAALPPSLSGERNVGSRTGPTWAGPTPLADLLR